MADDLKFERFVITGVTVLREYQLIQRTAFFNKVRENLPAGGQVRGGRCAGLRAHRIDIEPDELAAAPPDGWEALASRSFVAPGDTIYHDAMTFQCLSSRATGNVMPW